MKLSGFGISVKFRYCGCSSRNTWWGLTTRASWGDRKMSVSEAGWFRLTSTLPWASGWLRASLAWAPLGSLSSSSLVDSLLTWTTVSSSPELRSITSARGGRWGKIMMRMKEKYQKFPKITLLLLQTVFVCSENTWIENCVQKAFEYLQMEKSFSDDKKLTVFDLLI